MLITVIVFITSEAAFFIPFSAIEFLLPPPESIAGTGQSRAERVRHLLLHLLLSSFGHCCLSSALGLLCHHLGVRSGCCLSLLCHTAKNGLGFDCHVADGGLGFLGHISQGGLGSHGYITEGLLGCLGWHCWHSSAA